MRTLELKDIACYLPYELKVYSEEQESKIDTVIGVFLDTFDFEHWSPLSPRMQLYKPILHPMTDITKEIVVDGYNDGKPFVPAKKLFVNNIDIVEGDIYILYPIFGGCMSRCLFSVDTYCLSYKQIELLNQWNFDYKGLIKEGLAIDINEINK